MNGFSVIDSFMAFNCIALFPRAQYQGRMNGLVPESKVRSEGLAATLTGPLQSL